ncbi:MAG: hypothetical protein AAFO63_01460 [Pseudomonadota bacterium]
MFLFRLMLIAFLAVIAVYTVIVGMNHGWNLVPVFFDNVAAMSWSGQFNLDFMIFLILSASWVIWRNGINAAGLGLGAAALFGGMLFLSIYLLVLSVQPNASLRSIMLGRHN